MNNTTPFRILSESSMSSLTTLTWCDICFPWTRKPSWRKGYARQRRHSKMAVRRHLGFYRTGNNVIRSADPENPCLERNMQWIGCTVSEIFAFKLYCDLETGVRGHSRWSKVPLGTYDFVFVFYSKYASIYYRFRDIAAILDFWHSKVAP